MKTKKFSKKELKEINSVLATVKSIKDKKDAVKGSYFWNPPSSANQRRSYEKYHSTEWKIGDTVISLDCSVSCKNVYMTFSHTLNEVWSIASELTGVKSSELKKMMVA
jgi:hypothetical protein